MTLYPVKKMILLILLMALCDIYPVSAPDDSFIKEFSVPEPLGDKWAGCTASPFSGEPVDLTIPKYDTLDPTDESPPPKTPLVLSRLEKIPVAQLQQAEKNIIPPKPPDEPLFFMTPEPAAIIVLPGLLLLFLLFGRRHSAH